MRISDWSSDVCSSDLLQFELVFNRPVNWDEFFHLSEAHAFHQGRLTEALQVFYARAFFWLPMLPIDAVDQIRVARLFMFGFELFTLCAIYGMARHFSGRLPGALRSEEHTSELQSLMRISYAVFCLKKKIAI